MIDWKTAIVIFFYNTAKSFVRGFMTAFGIPDDILMLIIGWLVSKYAKGYEFIGDGIMYGAIASLGAGGVQAITSLFAPPQQAPARQAPAAKVANNIAWY